MPMDLQGEQRELALECVKINASVAVIKTCLEMPKHSGTHTENSLGLYVAVIISLRPIRLDVKTWLGSDSLQIKLAKYRKTDTDGDNAR